VVVKNNRYVKGMPTSRSYDDACTIARALDVLGERWALLVVRELLFGPRRFSELRRALPGASSNLLTDRLRELETNGVVARAGGTYELTASGRELEPVLLALGNWGSRRPVPENGHLSAASVLLYLRDSRRPEPGMVYHIYLDGRPWTVRTVDGRLSVRTGADGSPDAVLRTDPVALNALLQESDAPLSAL
jgi:DNA-binding HxlR family transcriptional regulator